MDTRAKLLIKRGNKCEVCGVEGVKNNKWVWEGKKPNNLIEVHHKDGNHFNNNPSNIQLLCLSCHKKTDNWASKMATNFLTIAEATKLTGKSKMTIWRLIQSVKENDTEMIQIKEYAGFKGKQLKISEDYLRKLYNIPDTEMLKNVKDPIPPVSDVKQPVSFPNNTPVSPYNKKLSKENKGLKHYLENIRFENVGLKKDVEHLSQNIQNREQALLKKETEMKEKEQKLHSSLVQLGIEKGRADGLENQIKMLTAPKKKWWQK